MQGGEKHHCTEDGVCEEGLGGGIWGFDQVYINEIHTKWQTI